MICTVDCPRVRPRLEPPLVNARSIRLVITYTSDTQAPRKQFNFSGWDTTGYTSGSKLKLGAVHNVALTRARIQDSINQSVSQAGPIQAGTRPSLAAASPPRALYSASGPAPSDGSTCGRVGQPSSQGAAIAAEGAAGCCKDMLPCGRGQAGRQAASPTHHNLLDPAALHFHLRELLLQRHPPPAWRHGRQARQRKGRAGVVP